MIEPILSFTVYGNPAPQGSKKTVGQSKTGRYIMVEDCERVYPWRDLIRAAALKAWIPNLVLDIPIMFEATCTLKPPKVIPKARNGYATAKPDYDKLARAIGDAITHTKKQAGIIKDDSLIIRGLVSKTYPYDRRFPDALDQPGAVIHIYPAGDYR